MPQPLTPETLVYGFTGAGDPQLSPDGARIAYVVSRTDQVAKKGNSQIWLAASDGTDARQLTQVGDRNGSPRWSPDGARLAFISDRGGRHGLYVLRLDSPGDPIALTTHPNPIGDLAWSPDGTRIAYVTLVDPANPRGEPRPADAPPPVRVTRRIDYKQDNRGYLNDTRLQVFVVDAATGERRQVTRDLVDHNSPAWSPDGSLLAVRFSTLNGICSQLGLYGLDERPKTEDEAGETAEARQGAPNQSPMRSAGISNQERDAGTGVPRTAVDVGWPETVIGPQLGSIDLWAWSPSGEHILYAGEPEKTWQPDWYLYDVAGGTTRQLTTDLHVSPDSGFPTILPPAQPAWIDNRTAVFHAARAGKSGLYQVDTISGDVTELQSWPALNAGLSADRAGRRFALAHASPSVVGEIVVFDRWTRRTQQISRFSAQVLAESPAASIEAFQVQRGGLTIDAWLLKPPDFDPTKRYPVVLDVHGGPNGHYGYAFNAVQQTLATHGFLVVYANPRGSTSYGRDFTAVVLGDWGGEDYLDLMAVVDEVAARPYVDPARLGIWGFSYGGYMTAWAIGQTDRFRAAVCGAPCFDLVSMYGTSDIAHVFGDRHWRGQPHEHEAFYRDRSPITYAHRISTPTLIIQGENDERCPIGQGEQMFVTLLKNGCEVEFARYPGGSHLFLRVGHPEHRVDALTRILGWFQSKLGAGGR